MDPIRLYTCILQRVSPFELFKYNIPTDEKTQALIVPLLLRIATENPYYARQFLTRYIKQAEKDTIVDDELYSVFTQNSVLLLLEPSPTETHLVEYKFSDQIVRIIESPRVISGAGGTGWRTWEAALFLLHWLRNRNLSGKSVIELGAGTGLVSLSLIKNYSSRPFKSLKITDGDSTVCDNIRAALKYNNSENVPCSVEELWWGRNASRADVVVAADVTYDSDLFGSLTDQIESFLQSGTQLVVIALTNRNSATTAAWEKEIERFEHTVERCAQPHLSNWPCWFSAATPEIKLYVLGDSTCI